MSDPILIKTFHSWVHCPMQRMQSPKLGLYFPTHKSFTVKLMLYIVVIRVLSTGEAVVNRYNVDVYWALSAVQVVA